MRELFSEGGLLYRKKGYQFREDQLKMAEVIKSAIECDKTVIVEAPTGTGKGLSYLVPSILHGGKILISTATKALQDQLLNKDIPELYRILPKRFRYMCAKGRNNYVCINKLENSNIQIRTNPSDKYYIDLVRHGLSNTGDRDDIPGLHENWHGWNNINAKSEACTGKNCIDYDRCFLTRLRREAQVSNIVVVNHHLLFSELFANGTVVGVPLNEYSAVILDEAHEIEDIVSSTLENRLLADTAAKIQLSIDLIPMGAMLYNDLSNIAAKLVVSYGNMWGLLEEEFKAIISSKKVSGNENRFRFPRNLLLSNNEGVTELSKIGDAAIAVLTDSKSLINALGLYKETTPQIISLQSKIENVIAAIKNIIQGEDYISWFEELDNKSYIVGITPIKVDKFLREEFFSYKTSFILTSATLAANGKFEFVKKSLGIDDAVEMILPTPFDYKKQGFLYIPNNIPDPRSRDFVQKTAEESLRIIDAVGGRTLILFTSFAAMKWTYNFLRTKLRIPCIMQGQGPKNILIKKFVDSGGVLLATNSFWQGIDIVGSSLSCVIIPKLPFSVPTDPIFQAKCKVIEDSGKNPFSEFSLPEAIIMLKQGVGRLIRSSSDKGLLVIMDPRVITKEYGKTVIRNLPAFSIGRDLNLALKVLD